ncbi:hypothetical protein GCM10007424_17110 [Flavobacterium suaedae]|uniref:ABC transporter permease n=1 Tax=Flavobacterium suaedae TaxID=1767027 RepID=A0ABQ1JVA6_9FLAO|nr:DUF5687 family protein [Flavobacterium suaedae]GGB77614.1 hypothetical protein GCM10007424_17110 [Flavobacterium suaedae]
MFKKFISLEWKAFFRSSALTGNLVITILKIIGALYFMLLFVGMSFIAYFGAEDSGSEPLVAVNKYVLYYLIADLTLKLLLQKIPVINVKPLLTLNIKRSTIVNFAIGKTLVSFFNTIHLFFLVPFTIILVAQGHGGISSLLWFLGILFFIYCNNFINLLLDSKTNLLVGFVVIVGAIIGLQYYGVFDVTEYTGTFFYSLYSTNYMVAIPAVLLIVLWVITFKYFRNHLYLDTGLSKKHEEARTENYNWLNRYGVLGTFLKNDIRMIKRNKRSRSSVIMSFVFVFYGLLFFTGALEMYDNTFMHMFAAIFVTGGFMFTFGQFVPSWDSAYYPLMMSQNIKYKEYISAKWWLVVIGTIISTILATFYLYFGADIYLMIIAAAVFNIGVNSHLVLLGGAYVKTPIDLGSAKQAFGDKKAFNVKTMLLSLPKMLLPMALYAIGEGLIGKHWGVILVIATGVLGFAFRNTVFKMIEKVYKTEKYSTLHSYKQKN